MRISDTEEKGLSNGKKESKGNWNVLPSNLHVCEKD